LELYWLLSVIY